MSLDVARMSACATILVFSHSLHLQLPLKPPVPKRQRRKNEKIQNRRCDEAAQNDDGHRPLDLLAGFAAAERERQQSEGCHQGGHHNRIESLGSAPNRRMQTPLLALMRNQMLVMGDHHDGISGGDPEESYKAHHRSDREISACEEDCEYTANQGEGQIREDQDRITNVIKGN